MPQKCISPSLSSTAFLLGLLTIGAVAQTSCAHYSFSACPSDSLRISVPYAYGDDTGSLTHALVSSLANKTNFLVAQDCRYELIVTILDSDENSLAYRSRNADSFTKTSEIKKGGNLFTCENRAKMLAEVEIVDKVTKKAIRGPGCILGSIEYDTQHRAKNNKMNRFSLGQLGDTYADQDVLPSVVYQDLAEKIAFWVQQQYNLLPFGQSNTKNNTKSES